MAPESGVGDGDTPVDRPESDDYDLLTFGEVAARLSELLIAERAELASLTNQENPVAKEIQRHENRIETLTANAARYRKMQDHNEIFEQRFGAEIRARSEALGRPDWS